MEISERSESSKSPRLTVVNADWELPVKMVLYIIIIENVFYVSTKTAATALKVYTPFTCIMYNVC